MREWLAERGLDVLCLQEVRAPDEIMQAEFADWHQIHAAAAAKGRAGVAVLSRHEPLAVRTGVGHDYFADSGRWVEMDLELPGGAHAGSSLLTVVSVYVHSGEAGTPKQDDKYLFMDAMHARMACLKDDGRHVLVVGDVNICHREVDLKNWRGNLKKSGFLPEERAWVDTLFDGLGYVDVQRSLVGDIDGPYSWWSNRGQAFDNDTGWRIDYHLATPHLAAQASRAVTDRAPSYDTRWSDHAPVVVDYDV
jgi:exodeoxyribonuclease-3